MENILLYVSDKVLFEYVYNNKTINTATYGFRKISNAYEGVDTIVNVNSAQQLTENVVDNTVVDLPDGTYALLDNDTAYWYPAVDPNITVNPVVLINPRPLSYDTIRVHLVSGFNFDKNLGFILSIYCMDNQGKPVKLCNFAWTKDNFQQLYFAPNPKKIDVQIFDKYVEFSVPSFEYILQEQLANPLNTDNLSYVFTNGKLMANQHALYCSFHIINAEDTTEGFTRYSVEQGKKFRFNSIDEYNLLTADIQENVDGYFEYKALWNGLPIEDFITGLNSIAGNNYYLIHELYVHLQTGNSFQQVEGFTEFQKQDYQKTFLYKPVLPNLAYATAISIDYYVRLYNAVDGKNVIKSATLNTLNINKYGMQTFKINVGDTSRPVVAVNKIQRNDITLNNPEQLLQERAVSYIYIDNNNLTLGDSSIIQVNPFDNLIKFDIATKDQRPFELDEVNTYYLTFILSDGSKLYCQELLSAANKKSEGELIFKVDAAKAQQILSSTNNSFYVISKSPNALETNLVNGFWQKEPIVIKAKSIEIQTAVAENIDTVANDTVNAANTNETVSTTTNNSVASNNAASTSLNINTIGVLSTGITGSSSVSTKQK